ncbi:unnamed protein product [Paramecium pentaurelia]|uniref:Transmembrane protein n=1 Tax=Paramecium pentaurelia TaxID=43138 RepID=A0A8S1WBH8_9CILI|nr:unnamed protein product [Paramecium pentaurelia]
MNYVTIQNSTAPGFYLYLENEAFAQIQNTIVSFISSQFLNENENGGAFLIDTIFSISSVINFKNISAIEIRSRNKGGLIYIQNALENMIIKLEDVIINEVYSLLGSIFYIEFPLKANSQSIFKVENLEIRNTEQGFIRYLSQYNEPTRELLDELNDHNYLFQVANAKLVSFQNICIFSLFHVSFASLVQILIIDIINFRCYNSSIKNELFHISSMKENSQSKIVDFYASNISFLKVIQSFGQCSQQNYYFKVQPQICSADVTNAESPISLMNNFTKDTLSNSYCIIQQLNYPKWEHFTYSLILDILDINILTIFELHLNNIDCQECFRGLVSIKQTEIVPKIIMKSILFSDNTCDEGCLYISSFDLNQDNRNLGSLIPYVKKKQFAVILQNYRCFRNFAYGCTCLFSTLISILIEDSFFQNNTAIRDRGIVCIENVNLVSFNILNSVIQQNDGGYVGGLYVMDSSIENLTKLGTLINDNTGYFQNNLMQQPSQLSIQLDKKNLWPKIKIFQSEKILIEQIQIGQYELFQESHIDVLYIPNGQKISEYKFFDWKNQNYVPYNLSLIVVPLDQLNNIQMFLDSDVYCSMKVLLENEYQRNIDQGYYNFFEDYEEEDENYFQKTIDENGFIFDDVIFHLDDELNQTQLILFHCSAIKVPIYGENQAIIEDFHFNYFLRLNIKPLPCQLGEKRIIHEGCIPCDASIGQYSVTLNTNKCSIIDEISTQNITSAQLNLRQGFWRPYVDTNYISECINLPENCEGGFHEGDKSCFQGHIGALCEECDIHNIRLNGSFSTSQKYSCGLCVEEKQNFVAITAISSWTLISILLSVQSNYILNKQMILKKIVSSLIMTKISYHSNLGILIKMITHHFQIVSVIFTFRFKTFIDIGAAFNSISNPIQKITHSLDCLLKDIISIQIHYSRMIWQLIMPFIYILFFLGSYRIALKLNKLEYSLNVITTTLIYMYLYLQPFFVGGLISLISFRKISGFYWIQANVAYRYDTQTHYQWLFIFCLPLLLLISLIIPVFFLVSLYSYEYFFFKFLKITSKISFISYKFDYLFV